VINAFGGAGINLLDSNANAIIDDFIGTDVTGTQAVGNGIGVQIVSAASNTVGGSTTEARNLISGNTGIGVSIFVGLLSMPGNVVEGNYIGTDVTGSQPLGNAEGVVVNNAVNNQIGGTMAGAGNLISGNRGEGVRIYGGPSTGSTGNVVQGNRIGTDVTGTRALGNATGVILGSGFVDLTANNTVGGTAAAAGNLIAGNANAGVVVQGSVGNQLQGNRIGTDTSGTRALPNATGVALIGGASHNTVGGTAAGARNLISGNTNFGVQISDSTSQSNQIQGNTIGADVTGTVAVRNTYGVYITGASNNLVGATTAAGRNLISGNFEGVVLFSANGNLVEGNFIGTDGAGLVSVGNLLNGVDLLSGSNNLVGGTAAGAGNVISGNPGNGVAVFASSNQVAGNFVGTDPTGTLQIANGTGVYVSGPSNTVGGAEPGAGNLISGNSLTGIELFGAGALGNQAAGNFIGTDVTGTQGLPNGIGISIDGGSSNFIGGLGPAFRNVVSGNTAAGIRIQGSGNAVQGNFIGTDATGTVALPNGSSGLQIISGATGNTIGGTAAASNNLISGNAAEGLLVAGDYNVVQGNFIGTDITGTAALGNRLGGVIISQGSNNTIGGTAADAGNMVSANSAGGVAVGGTGNVVQGNLIGTDITGTQALGNQGNGLSVGSSNQIGGTAAGAGNVISGNMGNGVVVGNNGTVVQGNRIGTDVTGTVALGNHGNGVTVGSGDLIGGTQTGAGNLISGNGGDGIGISGLSDLVQGNLIGTDVTGTVALGNAFVGVYVDLGYNNVIGGIGGGNVISANGTAGIQIDGTMLMPTGNLVQGNYIGTDATGTRALGNTIGVTLEFAPNNTVGGTAAGAGNIISGNTGIGIEIFGFSDRNVIQGNYIGTDVTGTLPLGNKAGGVRILLSASNNQIGGTAAGARNVISANGNQGILISEATDNVVQGNYIGTDATGTQALANPTGVVIQFRSRNCTVGGTAAGAGNLIAGNEGDGIMIIGSEVTGTVVQGNYIGTDATGTQALGNQRGVNIFGQANLITIGGTAAGAGNLISGNAQAGIFITQTAGGNVVQGNRIGTDHTGTQPIGNGVGVEFVNAGANVVGGTAPGAGNTIAFNARDGVLIDGTVNTPVLRNSIFGNRGLGIELLHHGNNDQAAPVLGSAISADGITTIQGTLTSRPSTTYLLEFFADSGDPAQGRQFLGAISVTTDTHGVAVINFTIGLELDPGEMVTATATDPNGNTSEFSAGVLVTS
jgi:hypothetical protein